MSAPLRSLEELAIGVDYGVTASASASPVGPQFLRITDIQDERVDWSTVPFCVAQPSEEAASRLQTGDIVFARTGATTGKSFLLRTCPSRAVFASYLIRVRPDPSRVEPRYLAWYFQTPDYWRQITSSASGTAQPGVNASKLKDLVVPTPALSEQRRIADILDMADAIRRKRKEAIALTEELLRSAFLEMFGDPVANPKGWATQPLGEIANVTDGTHKTPVYMQSGVRFLSAKNVRAHAIDWTNTRFIAAAEHAQLIRRCRPQIGNVLLTKSGTIGEAACIDRDIEFSLFESVALLTVDRSVLDPQFVATLLNDERVRRQYGADVKGVGVKHLHLVDIRRLPVIAPPLADQARFLRASASLRSARSQIQEATAETQRLFDALAARAFRDEPAPQKSTTRLERLPGGARNV